MAVLFSQPPLSVVEAHALAGFCAASYVGILYVLQQTRISYRTESAQDQAKERARRRDDPDVIRARLIAVSISTVLSCVLVFGAVRHVSGGNERTSAILASTWIRLGLTSAPILPCLVAPVLYSGPLYVAFLSGTLPLQRGWSIKWNVTPVFTTWIGWRNYIIAPATEETVFRACVLALYHMAGVSSNKLIFLSPLWFGLAHVHHGWEIYYRLGCTRQAMQNAAMSVLFQLAYTTLFGFHCAYLFLRTGSLLPPVASHIFCNIMGLPGFGSDVAQYPHRRTAIIAMYIIGIVGYIYTLRSWTTGDRGLYWTPPGSSVIY
ncbi:hypothetical protein BDW22DRAFT_1364191 [Trametopsis cervina]|nr:hypothetical protein BDW22DRAFT_1364191 [Trametopsis cervina]